ncbi:MAG: DMT family transporter [Firmicutes bacterium]|nr:DMT family transporter [Bacillota bacterium]
MAVLIKKAQEHADPVAITFVSIFTNFIIFGAIYAALLARETAPPFDLRATSLFFVGGIFISVVGRYCTYTGIRYIGPSRNTAIRGSIPLFTLVLAFIFIRESPSLTDVLGMILVVSGLIFLARENPLNSRSSAAAGGGNPESASRLWTLGIAFSFGGAFAQAVGSTIMKAGLNVVGSSLQSAFIGSWAGMIFFIVLITLQGKWSSFNRMFKTSFVYITGAALANSAAAILAFSSFTYTNVATSEALIGTQPLLTILLSAIVLGRMDFITRPLMMSALLIVGGALALVW